MRERGAMATTRKEAMERDIVVVVSLLIVAEYMCFSKQQYIGLDSVQHL